MRISLPAVLVSTLVLTGCGAVRDSSLNPFNWFGGSRAAAATASDNPLIPQGGPSSLFRRAEPGYAGQPVDQIGDLAIERIPGGAILRVTGIAASQGSHDVRLLADTPDGPDNGTLRFTLAAETDPRYLRVTGPERGRTVNAARYLSLQQLEGVRAIEVRGARNARVTRR